MSVIFEGYIQNDFGGKEVGFFSCCLVVIILDIITT